MKILVGARLNTYADISFPLATHFRACQSVWTKHTIKWKAVLKGSRFRLYL